MSAGLRQPSNRRTQKPKSVPASTVSTLHFHPLQIVPDSAGVDGTHFSNRPTKANFHASAFKKPPQNTFLYGLLLKFHQFFAAHF
jgi:hypothetical protein